MDRLAGTDVHFRSRSSTARLLLFSFVACLFWLPKQAPAAPLNPNNFSNIFSALEPSSTVTISTSGTPTMSISGGPTFVGTIHSQGAGKPDIAVFTFGSIHVPNGITIDLSGSRPVALLSKSTLVMNGTVNLNLTGGYAGGNAAFSPTFTGTPGLGPGGGLPAVDTQGQSVGGGGAGFGGAGGNAGSNDQSRWPGGSGGAASGNLLVTLEGGSGGGGGSNGSQHTGGTGGGAMELGAIDAVTMAGQITANGNPGNSSFGGAGSGGGVLMHGSALDLEFNQELGDVETRGGSGTNSFGGAGGGLEQADL